MNNELATQIIQLRSAIAAAESTLAKLEAAAGLNPSRKHKGPRNSKFVTVSEAAEMMCCSGRTVTRRLSDGDITAVVEGKRILIHKWSVDAYLDFLQPYRPGRCSG